MDVFYGGLFDPNAAEELDNFGDGNSHTIDSTQPFKVRHEFNELGSGQFGSYVTTLTQDSATLTLDSTGCDDASSLAAMTDDMKNMVLVISNWEQQRDDLTHEQCDANVPCSNELSQLSIANIKITSKAGVEN